MLEADELVNDPETVGYIIIGPRLLIQCRICLRKVLTLAGAYRLRVPIWEEDDCRDCRICQNACPERAILRAEGENGKGTYAAVPEKCIGCGICAASCPCGVWRLRENTEPLDMYR